MCLTRPEGQDNSAQGLYVFAPVLRPEGPAPKGQESLAQGLPWVSRNKRFALKGQELLHATRFKGSEPILAAPGGPFRANWVG
jgi:hypothetical protein